MAFARKKVAMFTDIHFGRRNNAIQHNQDCLDFVHWFIERVQEEGDVTHIAFLGDWFENRNAVNVLTMSYAQEALASLNALGIPIFIVIGNHDLYHRESRKVYSTKIFDQFQNVTLVNDILVVEDLLISAYLFKGEYARLAQWQNVPYWMGHFEFKNFVVTGSDRKMEHGPDHTLFKDAKFIFSGHFHKRQANDNVIYIGNAFPMDYGDVWDDARGMCILDTGNDDVSFIDWVDCPKYRKVKLSDVIDDPTLTFPPKCRVRCLIDIDIGYSEAQTLREEITKEMGLREFVLEENLQEKKDALEGEELLDDFDIGSLNDAVIKMIKTGLQGTTTIDPNRIVDIYSRL